MALCVGVLALQGAFREHVASLSRLGVKAREVRNLKDMDSIGAMVIPGGESTTMGKLLTDWGMLEPLRARITDGMPVYGSCAGLILLCREIEGSDQPRLGVLDAVVRRNAFGRQVDSFETLLDMPELSRGEKEQPPFPAVFIRAPVIVQVGPQVQVLAEVKGQAVAVRQQHILATSFHPELTADSRLHSYFLDMCACSSAD